jgi:hypothetical protein
MLIALGGLDEETIDGFTQAAVYINITDDGLWNIG